MPIVAAEGYTGPRFTTTFSGRNRVADYRLHELRLWCRRFAESGLAPVQGTAHTGNLSIRHGQGFIITAARTDLGSVMDDDFTAVMAVDTRLRSITAQGPREPSSESFMHALVYAQRPDVHAVFHGHDELILQYGLELKLPSTAHVYLAGTLRLAREVASVLEDNSYLMIKAHGFLVLERTMELAGQEALRLHRKAVRRARLSTE